MWIQLVAVMLWIHHNIFNNETNSFLNRSPECIYKDFHLLFSPQVRLAIKKSIFVINHYPGNTGCDGVSILKQKDSGKGFKSDLKKDIFVLSNQNSLLVAHETHT